MEMEQPPMCPKTWLIESILVTIFCCLPFGIVGIIYANKVSTFYTLGKFDEATLASANAKKWTTVGFICGAVVIALYIILIVAGIANI